MRRPTNHQLDNTVDRRTSSAEFLVQHYCRASKLSGSTPYQAWYFGDSQQLAHELVELVLHGPKRATAGLGFIADRVSAHAPPCPTAIAS